MKTSAALSIEVSVLQSMVEQIRGVRSHFSTTGSNDFHGFPFFAVNSYIGSVLRVENPPLDDPNGEVRG